MKKVFSLVLALVMVLSLTTMAWGADVTLAADTDATANNAVAISGSNCEYATALAAGETFNGAGYTYTVTGSDATKEDVAIYLTGDAVIENVMIDCAERAIDTDVSAVTSVEINNVIILNSARAIHIQAPADLVVTDSVIAGKVSYLLSGGTATFINCTFVKNGVYEDCIEPWSKTVFINCTFEEGFNVSLEDWNNPSADGTKSVELTDCIYDGELLTADNMDDFFTNTTGVTVENVSTATATAGAKVTFHAADESADGWALLDIFAGADLDDFVADDDNYLPCYEIPGYGFFVETNAASGAYKLVYGAKTVYLKSVDWDTVYFDAKATVFTNVTDEDDVCGKLYVADLDDKDVFYSVYVKADKTTYYFVADKDGVYQLLVNGKLVKANLTAVQDLTAHAWAGYDVVNYEYTTVKCANCGKVAPLFANATAAGKDAFKVVVNGETLGWIAKVANDFTAAGSVSAGTTTGKVESAQTFDAGIAMYVGMSVMAAAGSAVVIGKKKD